MPKPTKATSPDAAHLRPPIIVDLDGDAIMQALTRSRNAIGDATYVENVNKVIKNEQGRYARDNKEAREWFRVSGDQPVLSNARGGLACAQREAYIVAAKTGSRKAHEVLLALVTALEDASCLKADGRLPNKPNAEAQTECARSACRHFARIVGADCTVVYFWDRQTNRTKVLCHDVRWPEAIDGISFAHDLPRVEMFNDDVVPPVEQLHPQDSKTQSLTNQSTEKLGTFRLREGVETCWAVRVRWSQGRLILFLNWRAGSKPRLYAETDGGETGRERLLEPRDIRPAARFLSGYLSTLNLEVRDQLKLPSWKACEVVSKLWEVVRDIGFSTDAERQKSPQQQPTELRELTRRVREVLHTLAVDGQSAYRSSLHWTNWDTLPGAAVTTLYFRRAGGPMDDSNTNQDFKLGDPPHDDQGKVEKSVTYQAACWGVPLLIPDIEGCPNSSHWKKIDLPPAPSGQFLTRSEIAVPFKDSRGRLMGVFNAEAKHANAFDAKELRAVQLAGSVFARMVEAKVADSSGWSFLETALSDADPETQIDGFVRRFCDFVLKNQTLMVDHVYLLTYDAETRVFRPRAVRCKESHYLTWWNFKRKHDSSWPKQLPKGSDCTALIDAAISQLLLPKRRGRSYEAFARGRSIALWPTEHESTPPSLYTKECFRAAVGVPFRSDIGAQPDGVIWLRWEKDPVHLLDEQTRGRVSAIRKDVRPPSDLMDSVKDQLKQKVEAELRDVVAVVSSIYSLLRVGEAARSEGA